jgi:hypothetical protein
MPQPILIDFLSILFSVITVGVPLLLLRNYQPHEIQGEQAQMFDTFRWVEIGWGFFLCVYLLFIFIFRGHSNYLIGLAFLLAAMNLPSAAFASITGLYPRNRGRALYDFLQKHKNPKKQYFFSTGIPSLQVLSWAQLVLLITAVMFTFLRL